MEDERQPTPTPVGGKPCCIRCAQLYSEHPDLQCDPYLRDERRNEGVTRRESHGCRRCRTFKHKCRPVPLAHASLLTKLQDFARTYDSERRHGFAIREFYRLRECQEVLSRVVYVGMDLEDDGRLGSNGRT